MTKPPSVGINGDSHAHGFYATFNTAGDIGQIAPSLSVTTGDGTTLTGQTIDANAAALLAFTNLLRSNTTPLAGHFELYD